MFRRILLATDFSEHSRCAWRWAVELARMSGGTLVLVHVLEEGLVTAGPALGTPVPGEVVDLVGFQDRFRETAAASLEREAEELRELGVPVEAHLVEEEPPSRAIVAAAQRLRCGVIVLATHGRSGLAHLLIGSTAEKVVRSARCPVLTVHQGDLPDDDGDAAGGEEGTADE